MKFAIREAIDVYFKAKSTFTLGARTIRAGEPVLIFDTVKTSTLEVAATTSYVTGGRGNARLLSYEGDKTLTFQFEDALLSNEGMAILAGADMIPARNANLPGSSPDAKSVITHKTETYSVVTANRIDGDTNNVSANDEALGDDATVTDLSPMGGMMNVWLTSKPYVGQNSTIYVMLLDSAGEMSGSPIQINLGNTSASSTDGKNEFDMSYLGKFDRGDNAKFIAFDSTITPMSLKDYPHPASTDQQGVFDDMVAYYVDYDSAVANWTNAWGDISMIDDATEGYARTIAATGDGTSAGGYDYDLNGLYGYLVAPSGGYGQPKAYKEGNSIYYKLNVPSILYQDIVLVDYYVEYKHNATQISILPDKFAPYMYVEGSSLVRRASDGTDLPVEFVIPKFKVTTQLSFSLTGTGDPSTFTFQGDAYPDYSKFDLTRKVLADIQILDADDNYDSSTETLADPTSYRRYTYNDDGGAYIWKDPTLEAHNNIDISDIEDYVYTHGGAATLTPGVGLTDTAPSDGSTVVYPDTTT